MEPTVSSETSAIRTQMPGNYPKRNKLDIPCLYEMEGVYLIHKDVQNLTQCFTEQN